jgi:DNA helicase HerA-like ATPase
MNWLLRQIYGPKLRRETERYIRNLSNASVLAAHKNGKALIDRLQNSPGSKAEIGKTLSGRSVSLPIAEIIGAHGLITGGTGSGKTRFCLNLINALLDQLPHSNFGFGLVDAAKSDLYDGALYLLSKRIKDLEKTNPDAAETLRRRIVILDFSAGDPVSSFSPNRRIATWIPSLPIVSIYYWIFFREMIT